MPKYRSRSTSGTALCGALDRWTGHARRRPAPLLVAAIVLSPIAWSLCLGQAQGEDAAVAQGKALYAQNKCSICHSIGAKGGSVGPALDDAGKKWTPDKLVAFLQAPASVNADSAMPPMHGTPDQIKAVAAYMMSLGGTPKVVAPEPDIAIGQQLFASEHCFYCHQIGNKGGKLGPALDQEAERHRTPGFLATHFKRPDEVAPGTMMPVVQGTDRQLRSLAMFLLSQLTRIVPSAERGKQIYAQRSCGHCHGRDAQGTKTGPALAGAKGTARTDAWILEHFRNPSAVTPNSVMPRVWAAPWEMQSLLDYLKGLRA